MEHERDERALEPGALAAQHGEARAAQLGGALEVEDPEPGAEVDVVPGGEGQGRLLPPARHDLVVGLARAGRDARVRDVGEVEEALAGLFLDPRPPPPPRLSGGSPRLSLP